MNSKIFWVSKWNGSVQYFANQAAAQETYDHLLTYAEAQVREGIYGNVPTVGPKMGELVLHEQAISRESFQ